MLKESQPDKREIAKQAIAELQEILRPLVQTIEYNKVPLTKFHYAKYVEILGRFPSHQRQVMTRLLLSVGANKEGVAYAAQILGILPVTKSI